MLYQKINRVWSHNDTNHIEQFTKTFPELNKLSSEEMCDRWTSLGIDFYTQQQVKVTGWIRITLPFALILFALMTIFLPINFIITGYWGYSLSKKNLIFNWFKILRLQ